MELPQGDKLISQKDANLFLGKLVRIIYEDAGKTFSAFGTLESVSETTIILHGDVNILAISLDKITKIKCNITENK